jgi:hypothetical protein
MPLPPAPLKAHLFHGKVIAARPEERLVDVEWYDAEVKKQNVIVVTDTSNYAFPRVNEVGLVLGDDIGGYYWLGKIDFGYSRKLAGDINTETGRKWPVRKINPGESYITNLLQGIGLFLGNSGNFSLLSQFQDGVKYIAKKSGAAFRKLLLSSKSIISTASSVQLNLGSVIRKLPVTGESIITNETGLQSAQEFLAVVKKIVGVTSVESVKLHLGDILTEPVTAQIGVPQVSTTTGQFIRALLSVFDPTGQTELASLKMDIAGNIEITGTPTAIFDALLVYIGGNAAAATHQAVHADTLITWLNTHTHSSSVGPTGTVITPALPTDFASTKVFLA